MQRFEAVGHKAFAAWLVYGRDRAIGDGNGQSAATRGNRGSQSGWTSADDEYINRILRTQRVSQELKPSSFVGLSDTLNIMSFFFGCCSGFSNAVKSVSKTMAAKYRGAVTTEEGQIQSRTQDP